MFSSHFEVHQTLSWPQTCPHSVLCAGEGVTLSEGSRPLGASVQEFLQSCVETVPLPQPSRPAQLVFRGMRVRMGIRMCGESRPALDE